MKTFIDRVCPVYTMLKDKDVYFVVAAAGGMKEAESTAQSLRLFTGSLKNIKEKGIIAATGVWDVGGVKGSKAIKQAYTMGQNA